MKALAGTIAAAFLSLPVPALAWGIEGHQIIGHIAYDLLTTATRAKVDAILAPDTDKLTAPDFASRAAWADLYRNEGDKKIRYDQTHLWFFTDIELRGPNLSAACSAFPALTPETPASAGPAKDCLTAKTLQFETELAAQGTPAPEKLLALKYLLTMVGDVHMPFHVSDNHDDHANCLQVKPSADAKMQQLHHYWDDSAVADLIAANRAKHPRDDLAQYAARLEDEITLLQKDAWANGDARAWTLETYNVAETIGYDLPPHPECKPGMKWEDYPPFVVPAAYQARMHSTSALQMKKAGVRLAFLLNKALP